VTTLFLDFDAWVAAFEVPDADELARYDHDA
jgi:hypothetical protein